MNTLVIYDSKFGNTKIIAEVIARALPEKVTLLRPEQVVISELGRNDLLIIGAPTHGGHPSTPVEKMLKKINPSALDSLKVAAFDTRIPSKLARIFGFAAPRIAKVLEKMGGEIVMEPEGFYVSESEGPLVDGELERAFLWAREIAGRVEQSVLA